LATPAAPHAVSLLINMLSRPGRFPLEYSVLLEGLGYAAFWAMPLLNFPDLVRLLDNPDLGGERERLLHLFLEPPLFPRPPALTVPQVEGLVGNYTGNPSLKYLLYYLSCGAGLPADVRSTARAMIGEQFPLHQVVRHKLGDRTSHILIVQNIADRQGDEIIRV